MSRVTLQISSNVNRSKVKVVTRINDLGGYSTHHLLGTGAYSGGLPHSCIGSNTQGASDVVTYETCLSFGQLEVEV